MSVPPPHVIVQMADGGRVSCDGYYDLPNPVPAYIAIVTDGSSLAVREAAMLRAELRRQLTALPGARLEAARLPCGVCPASRDDFDCSAINRGTSQNVLVFLGANGHGYSGNPPVVEPSKQPRVLALFAPGTAMPVLPWSTPTTNSVYWMHHATEFVPDILAAAGLTDPEARVFISYRRKEAGELAEQLFDALSKRNFDVFVDRFRIEVGADFQQRILRELAHKSMVVFLESATILNSDWTKYEIAVAKSARLGVLALHLPNGQWISGIDRSRRVDVFPTASGILDDADRDDVVNRIVTEHSASQMRRRRLFLENMQRALTLAGVHAYSVVDGSIAVQPKPSSSQRYQAWLPSRPAELPDFHRAATATATHSPVRTIIGPAAHLVGDERRRLQWLGGVTGVRSFDEAHMLQVARAMAREAI